MPHSTSADHLLTRRLQAIADPSRRHILRALKERGGCSLGKDVGLCASDIEQRISLSQPTISHHMSVLTKSGLVDGEKLGQWIWYRRNEAAIREFARTLRESL
ncbi:MAG TPA: metalloregulator ArsR/SmtB family transcription factor [Terriglobales bacterium]